MTTLLEYPHRHSQPLSSQYSRTRTQPSAVLVLGTTSYIEYEYHFIEYEYDKKQSGLEFVEELNIFSRIAVGRKWAAHQRWADLKLKRDERRVDWRFRMRFLTLVRSSILDQAAFDKPIPSPIR
jgi:hypothetical protein